MLLSSVVPFAYPGRADGGGVVISSLSVLPDEGCEGDNVTITAELFNGGTEDLPRRTVELYDGFFCIGISPGTDVPANGRVPVSFAWTLPDVTADENHTLVAKADSSEARATVTVKDRQPKLEIEPVNLPFDLELDDLVEAWVTVWNNGTAVAMGLRVELYDGGRKLCATEPFDLWPGSGTELPVLFTVAGAPDTNHVFSFRAGPAEARTTRHVASGGAPSRIGIVDIRVAPENVRGAPAGSTQVYTLTVVLRNDGIREGTVALHLTEGTRTIANRSVTLRAGQAVTASFNWSVKGAGLHRAEAELKGPSAGVETPAYAECTLVYLEPGSERTGLDPKVVLAASGLVIMVLLLLAGEMRARRLRRLKEAAKKPAPAGRAGKPARAARTEGTKVAPAPKAPPPRPSAIKEWTAGDLPVRDSPPAPAGKK